MTIIEITSLFANISRAALAAGVVIGCIYYNRLSALHKAITVYLALMLLTEITNEIVGRIWHNNFIVLYLYCTAELAFMMFLYHRFMLRKKQRALKAIGVLSLLYIIAEALVQFVFKELVVTQFQPYAKVADNFVVILMALAFLHEKISRFRENRWGNFRLNSIVLLFFTLNTLIFLPFNFLVNEQSGIKFYFWTGNAILISLFYSYLAFEIFTASGKPGNRLFAGLIQR
jgi:hypothetical protein